ncbi:hypothetical protein XM38_007510 [Halomicronema hongdechloris C2206]|uniref:Uncharacterized protein n=1 Tax=Halomicronema hongdechloris C2206 TaxID=1641165 RepID=A0A1Z3HHS4_9CYAN|nr:hypothetical protein [Halomicronema hongdechloris]ASC69821.1 hypothetical protein XM38_007510 [Halomicronema hongdechloris C2206]
MVTQNLRQRLLPTTLTTLLLAGGAAMAQSTATTPLADPITVSGTASGQATSNCGFITDAPVQTLNVTESFASLDIEVAGGDQLTLLILGPDNFRECLQMDRFSEGVITAPGLLNQGNYDFYIGRQQRGTSPDYTLTIEQADTLSSQ